MKKLLLRFFLFVPFSALCMEQNIETKQEKQYNLQATKQLQKAMQDPCNINIEEIKILLKQNANPNAEINYLNKDHTPLTISTIHPPNYECLHLLLKYGANPNAEINYLDKDHTPLIMSTIHPPNYECLHLLLKYGANPNAEINYLDKDHTPLTISTIHPPNYECLHLLLKYGADPNKGTKQYPAPIHSLLICKPIYSNTKTLNKCIFALSQYGADLNNNKENTVTSPLERAVIDFFTFPLEILLMLLEMNTRIEISSGFIPLHYADNPSRAIALLLYGANPAIKDPFGSTFLHNASTNNSQAKVLSVLCFTKNPEKLIGLKDDDGKIAAELTTDDEIKKILSCKGEELTKKLNESKKLIQKYIDEFTKAQKKVRKQLLEFHDIKPIQFLTNREIGKK